MKRYSIHVSLSFFLISVLSLAVSAEEVSVEKADILGIYNYSHNSDPTGFGGTTNPSAMKALGDEGYKSVINLRLEGEKDNDLPASRMAAAQAGLNYIHLPLDTSNPDSEFFEQFLSAVGNEANQPAYIHCGSATRVAAIWMSKRVIEDGWSMELATEEARAIAGKPDAAVAFAEKYIETQRAP